MQSALRVEPLPMESVYRYHLLKLSLERFARRPAELQGREREQVETQARRSLELESLVLASAEARDVHVPTRQVESAFREVAGRYGDAHELAADLAANDLDEETLRLALQRELRFAAVMERVGNSQPAPDAVDVELYYQLNPDKFTRPERRTVRHVLITINPDYAENTRSSALARIRRVADGLTGPDGFADLAMRHSECPSALQGGLIGTVPRGQLHPTLDEALFAMEEGAVSGVVESEVGFHLLLCEAVEPARKVTLEEAAPRIRRLLEERLQRSAQNRWLRSLQAAGSAGHG